MQNQALINIPVVFKQFEKTSMTHEVIAQAVKGHSHPAPRNPENIACYILPGYLKTNLK